MPHTYAERMKWYETEPPRLQQSDFKTNISIEPGLDFDSGNGIVLTDYTYYMF